MLQHLYIKNFALIDELDVDIPAGFSVITGETGAGKSIILGALGLLSGARADVKSIKEGAPKCVVEAVFGSTDENLRRVLEENDVDVFGEECTLRREISSSGKSRAFVNDTPASLTVLREISSRLIDIHSQHQNLLLKDNSFQLSVVDTVAGTKDLKEEYSRSYESFRSARAALAVEKERIDREKENIDFIRFQYDELSRLGIREGEEEQLEKNANTMRHAEEIKSALFDADADLGLEESGVLARLHHCLSRLDSVADVYEDAGRARDRIDGIYIELKDLASDISGMLSGVEYDPEETERITNRLDAIYTLEKKHRVADTAALARLEEDFRKRIEEFESGDEIIARLEKELRGAEDECTALAGKLGEKRRLSAGRIEKEITSRLVRLGLENVRFRADISEKELSPDGGDRVEFLFSANPGTPLRAVSDVASGGETARVMLSLKALLSSETNLPTIIFDEIDTGVSGRTAEQMALTMKEMCAFGSQVINITHLPQIAASGSAHFKVYKETEGGSTFTRIKPLSGKERVEEIAGMLSGNDISEPARDNARRLLGIA